MDNKTSSTYISVVLTVEQASTIYIALANLVNDLDSVSYDDMNLSSDEKKDFEQVESVSKFLMSVFDDVLEVEDEE